MGKLDIKTFDLGIKNIRSWHKKLWVDAQTKTPRVESPNFKFKGTYSYSLGSSKL